MMGGIKAQSDCVRVLSEKDLAKDPRAIDVPTLVMHGDDLAVPNAAFAPLSAKLCNSALKVYEKFPDGKRVTHAGVGNDLHRAN